MLARKPQQGFTLIELGAVVAIVAVLSIIAAVGYRKIVQSSKTAEATHMVGAIRVAQEAFRAETGAYANVSPGLAMNGNNLDYCYPACASTSGYQAAQTAWGAACGSACRSGMTWSMLSVQAQGTLRYGYSTVAGVPGGAAPSQVLTYNGTASAWPATTGAAWYVVAAQSDLDGNGTYSTVVTSSFGRGVLVDSEGE